MNDMSKAAILKAATQEIEQAIHTYFDGLYEGDTEKLRRVFHPTCFLTYAEGGKLVSVARDEWFDKVDNRPKPSESGLSRHDEIVSIEGLMRRRLLSP